jgi:hypothetical protein
VRLGRPGLAEVTAVWVLLALVAVAALVTYARVPTGELYHVSVGGLRGGLGRALVTVNFPGALAAAATLPFVAARLPATRGTRVALLLSFALCAFVALPGVVDQDDLDATWVNAVPAAGVVLAVALWLRALRRGIGPIEPFGGLDWLRIGAAVVIVAAAIPWMCAEVGFYASDLPLVGRLFLAEQIRANPGGTEPTLHAVHLGRHHGMDGALLALSGLALSRVVARLPGRAHELAAFAVAALLVYGALNAAQDWWFEQVVKRGWTDWTLPSFLRPGLSCGWLVLIAATLAAYAGLRRLRPR